MLGDKGYIVGKEIEKEFLGVQRAANAFPLYHRSRASPHLDPMAALSSTGMWSEAANHAKLLCFSHSGELHQQRFHQTFMTLLQPPRFNRSLWESRDG